MALVPRTIHPVKGPAATARWVANPGRDSDRTPAIIWLSVALLVLWAVRNQAMLTAGQALTAIVAILGVVLVGSFTSSRLVTVILLALVVAAALGAAPQLVAWATQIQAKGITVARGQP